MKKILVFGMTGNPGGVESVIMNYYRNIDRTKIQFDFLCNTSTIAYESKIKKLGGNIYFIPSKRKNYFRYKKELNLFFLKNSKKYSAVWINICNLNNIDYLKLSKKYNISKRIIHSHNSQNMGDGFAIKLYNFILHNFNKRKVTKYATDFWSCSNEAAIWFYNSKIINSDKYKLINNAINTETFKFNLNERNKYRKKLNLEDKIIIGNIGRLDYQKNQKFLINIFNKIYQKNPNYHLLLIGQGNDYNALKEQVKSLKLENAVSFLGVRNDVPSLLQSIDIFLFPSLFEGLPVALMEAEASGVNIITSYEAFPNDQFLTNNIIRHRLDENIDNWVKSVLNIKNFNDEKRIKQSNKNILFIKQKKFDIKMEVKNFEKIFK